MSGFITTPLLITEYYDSLISQLDIYTEERIKEYNQNGLPLKTNQLSKTCGVRYLNEETYEFKNYGVETFKNPYKSQKYSINRTDISEITEISQAEDYINNVRQKAIDEIRKIKEENLEYYKANKEKLKVDKENLTEETLEELKSQLFADKLCFLIKREPLNILEKGSKESYGPLFNLHTVITDFYLRQSDIDYISNRIEKSYKINHPSTKLDKRFLLANQVMKYINETLIGDLNGNEIIQIKQKTLFEIQHIKVKSDLSSFNEADLSSIDMDLSAIKSLTLKVHQAKISDFNAFLNFEYLCISGIKLYQSPFKNLQKLIKLEIYLCDLSEFDFDSLNSLTSLQIIEISINTSVSLKIDLSRLINLKWLDLSFNNKVETTFELSTDDSYNQLTKVVLNNKTFDFSKPLVLPQLKCLYISEVDLSEQISKQSFNGIYNLIELNLTNTYLTNVDFLNTDRFGNLEILDLSNNEITVLRKGAFSKLKKLKKLNLYNNKIKELVIGIFEGLECLEYLDISFNLIKVKHIDITVFDGLNFLKNLFLRNHELKNLYLDYLKKDGLEIY